MVGIIALVIFFTVLFGGCDDNQNPQVRYLEEAVVRPMNGPNGPRYIDAWELNADGFPVYAAFGWEVLYKYPTGDDFCGPGIHTTFRIGDCVVYDTTPDISRFVAATGCGEEDETEVTAVSNAEGVSSFYVGLRGWPSGGLSIPSIWIKMIMHWEMGRAGCAATEVMFSQGQGMPFVDPRGVYWASWQHDNIFTSGGPTFTSPFADNIPEPGPLPNMNPVSPPKVPIAAILPVLAECANSLGYPPSNNADGGDFLIRSRWVQARANGDGWEISPASFIAPLPFDANDVGPVVAAAWPYAVSFHAPAASAGMGVIDAELSVVDPNGAVEAVADIQVHEVGQCDNCGEWVWRSDYILPLAGYGEGSLNVATDLSPTVLVVRLPRGYSMKIKPVITAATLARLLARLTPDWLALDSPRDINKDGKVDFQDYGAFMGTR